MIQIREIAGFGLRAGMALAVALLLGPSGLTAQGDAVWGPGAQSLSIDVRGGVAAPLSDLDEFIDAGGSFGGGIAWYLSPRFGLQGGVDYQMLSGGRDEAGNLAPDMTLLHATGGIEVRFFDPEGQNRWNGTLALGAGITSMETDDQLSTGAPSPIIFDQTYLSFQGSTKLAYQATPAVNLYLEPRVYLLATDTQDTAVFSTVFAGVPAFDTAWVLPIQLGLRLTL